MTVSAERKPREEGDAGPQPGLGNKRAPLRAGAGVEVAELAHVRRLGKAEVVLPREGPSPKVP